MPKQRLINARRIVVKLGSNVITAKNSLNLKVIESISRQISILMDKGIEDFGEGAAVSFMTTTDEIIGIGLVNYHSSDINLIKGLKTSQIETCLGGKHYDEIIHRNNLVLTADGSI